ncbi:MAG TPA: sodium:proton antiporter [Phycisphaerae bacterium]|nr:sodium:proton antiporter [Phycisphaerae bacterium]HOJ55137.1 sodium:proton antiporter [Phycisphaerae bacterium]HOL27339.1 sodium:proton antiporter [Phycisphaerae bacterium]HPP20721.1 sodium:proton antiporter [Phycisphaerae bacterium]HPU34114.1 sodium:proton antiporter [Phycisphaerae bacterium]
MLRTTRFYSSGLMVLIVGGWMLARPALAQEVLATQPADPQGGAAVLEQLTTTHPAEAASAHPVHEAPSLLAAIPFAVLLLSIALLPLIPKTAHWWHHNRNKLLVALVLAAITLVYYQVRGSGIVFEHHATAPGFDTVKNVLWHSVFGEYVPFIILLFSLYTISGGIQLRGDVRATPAVNTAFLGIGAGMASFVGTTGASMLLIRPLLQTNRERKHVTHTVIFFIFLVSNIGGSLLPIGDPPLFLGYLKGVPFLWTFRLVSEWGFCVGILLVLYYFWDLRLYRKEPPLAKMLDETQIEPLRINGKINFLWLLGVILAVALVVPGESFLGTGFVVPEHAYLRELILLAFVALGWITTPSRIREENQFDFGAIAEVAALFIGIFITMQAPIEILRIKGPELHLNEPWQFFWATGMLSSFLDNAPTYVVFFTTANALTHSAGPGILQLTDGNFIQESLLVAISLGAVFMGANTYIGNGPNFMVKSIAEQSGVKMPSFFGYMLYSVGILIPLFIVVTFVFL